MSFRVDARQSRVDSVAAQTPRLDVVLRLGLDRLRTTAAPGDYPASQQRVAVKLMGSAAVTTPAPEWDTAYAEKEKDFKEIYEGLQHAFPEATEGFDFYIDGDPPDKPDNWKMFTAYASAQGSNTLTIVRERFTDPADQHKRTSEWQAKGARITSLQVQPNPKAFTLNITKGCVAVDVVNTKTVYDVSTTREDKMLDGINFQTFQIVDRKEGGQLWTVPNTLSSRRILSLERIPISPDVVFSRADMAQALKILGISKVVVVSQARAELDAMASTTRVRNYTTNGMVFEYFVK